MLLNIDFGFHAIFRHWRLLARYVGFAKIFTHLFSLSTCWLASIRFTNPKNIFNTYSMYTHLFIFLEVFWGVSEVLWGVFGGYSGDAVGLFWRYVGRFLVGKHKGTL